MSKFISQPPDVKSRTASLLWKTNFSSKWDNQYTRAQKFLDSEILRYCDPLVPFLTGKLRDSGALGTKIGSGLVQWIVPYAKPQYYRKKKIGSKTGKLRGPFWFARMKEQRGEKLIADARKMAGGS